MRHAHKIRYILNADYIFSHASTKVRCIQFVSRRVTPLGHIIPIPNQLVFSLAP
jgi:ribosomal protein S27E